MRKLWWPSLFLVGCVLAIACSSDETTTAAGLAEGCIVNTDCNAPLVCAFRKCHVACETSRDCDPGQRCVVSDSPFHVCQLADERDCTYNSDCPGGQVCAVDLECRDECTTARDCVKEQVCTQGTCAEQNEIVSGKLVVAKAEGGAQPDSGQPCLYTSECPAPLVCRDNLCAYECLAAADCGPSLECVDNRCVAGSGTLIGPEGGVVQVASGQVKLTVPPNALSSRVSLAILPLEAYPEGALGSVYEIVPTGIMFAVPAKLTLSYGGVNLDGAAPTDLRVAQAVGSTWTALPAPVLDAAAQTVTADLAHLSVYGIINPNRVANDAGADVTGAGGSGGSTVDAGGPDADASVDARLFGVAQVAAGGSHTCILSTAGKVHCWGFGGNGELGYGNVNSLATAALAGAVDVGGDVTQICTGNAHTCALLVGGTVRCWGTNYSGQLGYVTTNVIGDDETPASMGDVDVGGTVTQIACGSDYTCALLDTGKVRCWGGAEGGQLGYGNPNNIGDDETPASAGDVDVGGTVVQIAASTHTCVVLDTKSVRCWGASYSGQLGYGNLVDIGDDEAPATAGDVPLGAGVTVQQVAVGAGHTCAVLTTGGVKCWGTAYNGQLGYANTNDIGDDEFPSSVGNVDVGGSVVQIVAGQNHTCALLAGGTVRCWGYDLCEACEGGNTGVGYGNTFIIGDDETPASAGNIDLGGFATQLSSGEDHTCAVLQDQGLICWGDGSNGKLGYGNTNAVGDGETPASVGEIPLF